jgi:nucleotide-binding universal stress UspA family protein
MPLNHLLAAVDDSEAGRHAFKVARDLAATIGARLSTMTVVGPLGSVPDYLIPFDPYVGHGIPGIEIARKAELAGVDLVILGRAEEKSCRPRVGSTADALVRRSRVPCFFVPLDQDEFSKAAVAVDGTERGMTVLMRLADLGDLGIETVDVRMVEPAESGRRVPGPPSAKNMRISRALHAAPGNGPRQSLIVMNGDPVPTLLSSLDEARRTVLVLGARRGGPAGGDPSSGVGRGLLFDAPCAVITIPI